MRYIITCIHYSLKSAEYVPVTVEAESLSKAKYKAFQAWKEAYRPTFKDQFKYFLKYMIASVEREESTRAACMSGADMGREG